MPVQNPYAQYQNNKIMTASPAELTLMLYEGAIKFCNISISALDEKNIPKAHSNIIKVQKIVDYLRETLDMRYPVAKDFDNIYVYLSRRLVEANIKKDKDILEEVNTHLRSVRDNWKEVMRVAKDGGKA